MAIMLTNLTADARLFTRLAFWAFIHLGAGADALRFAWPQHHERGAFTVNRNGEFVAIGHRTGALQ